MFSGWITSPLKGAFRGKTTLTFEEELLALSAT
jgi:hypothetical protein